VDHTTADSLECTQLLARVRQGEPQALDELLGRHQAYLHKVIEMRFDWKLRTRVDPADVVQQTMLEVVRRMPDYLAREPMPFRLWLRKTAQQCLVTVRRHHVEVGHRAVDREMALPDRSSFQLAQRLLAGSLTPGRKVVKQEMVRRVRQAMAQLPEAEREIILLRNFEELSNTEVAAILEIEPATASKRYGRALLRLHRILLDHGLKESDL
jgi:RNA polymerase sigma-70 factor (ECF subfamily)